MSLGELKLAPLFIQRFSGVICLKCSYINKKENS